VIAWRRGAVPEVIDHGVTGFIVNDVEGAVAAVDKVRSLDRRAVRRRFEQRFSAERMANDYVRVCGSATIEDIALIGGLGERARERQDRRLAERAGSLIRGRGLAAPRVDHEFRHDR
jgi:hypothetical protein